MTLYFSHNLERLGGREGSAARACLAACAVLVVKSFGILPAHAAELEVVDKLTVQGTVTLNSTAAVKIPAGTTAERPAALATGMLRYNTTSGKIEYYNGTDWIDIVGISTSPVAGGGDEVKEIGGYRIHTFKYSGTFTVYKPLTADILVVGGGGGGGQHTTTNANGGGGAGGVVYISNQALTVGNYTVTVGIGGEGYPYNTASRGLNGGSSQFGAYVAANGGGGGGSQNGTPGNAGGSGGGGTQNVGAGASNQAGGGGNITVYGNAGGVGNYTWTGGGGGGAGSAGVAGNACGSCAPSGNGGNGVVFDISGATVCYAGGGGGGANSSERAGDGFCGGGRGFGSTSYHDYRNYHDGVNPTTKGSTTLDAIPNTGGGGGAGTYWSNNYFWYRAGGGGSGIVIVRYRMP